MNTTAQDTNATSAINNCSDLNNRLDLSCIDTSLKNNQSSLVQLIFVVFLSGIWVIYLIFFNSRCIGFILSKIIDNFIKGKFLLLGVCSLDSCQILVYK